MLLGVDADADSLVDMGITEYTVCSEECFAGSDSFCTRWYTICLMTFLERVCAALNLAKVDYVIVGGYAVALHGAIRGTLDIDIALCWTRADLENTESALKQIGLVSRLPICAFDVFNYRDEYIQNRNLVAWNFHNPDDPSEQVDIIITFDAKGKKTSIKQVAKVCIPLLNIGDLMAMKKACGRPQDVEDVNALEKLQ